MCHFDQQKNNIWFHLKSPLIFSWVPSEFNKPKHMRKVLGACLHEYGNPRPDNMLFWLIKMIFQKKANRWNNEFARFNCLSCCYLCEHCLRVFLMPVFVAVILIRPPRNYINNTINFKYVYYLYEIILRERETEKIWNYFASI